MKLKRAFFMLQIFLAPIVLFAHSEDEDPWLWGPYHFHDNISIDFEEGSLLAFDQETDELLFEITPEFQLYMDGGMIKTSHDQEDLLRAYYEQAEAIIEEARKISYKGAHIGVEGAKVAVQAVGGIFELLFSGFDDSVMIEFEAEMDAETEDLEAAAELLEEQAEVIEDMVDELEVLYEDLQDEIPEIGDLE